MVIARCSYGQQFTSYVEDWVAQLLKGDVSLEARWVSELTQSILKILNIPEGNTLFIVWAKLRLKFSQTEMNS